MDIDCRGCVPVAIGLKRFMSSTTASHLAVKYSLFAGLSIVSNLASQWITGTLYSGELRIYVMIAVGTGVGLVIKYVLDKRFIFFYETRTSSHDLKTFIMYVAMGVLTTAVFWGTELAFYNLFSIENAKYVGGFLGLVVGYTTKFFLDRRWVFA